MIWNLYFDWYDNTSWSFCTKDNSVINEPTNATLKINDTNLYIPVITLSIQDYKKLIDQLKTGFERTIKWNKHRS